jgi:hypothetical protein
VAATMLRAMAAAHIKDLHMFIPCHTIVTTYLRTERKQVGAELARTREPVGLPCGRFPWWIRTDPVNIEQGSFTTIMRFKKGNGMNESLKILK